MSLLLALLTFLVGAALGVSVARRRTHGRETSATPLSPESATSPKGSVTDVVAMALDTLPSGVVIAEASGEIILKNAAARGITGVRHVDVLVDEAVEKLVRDAAKTGEQQRQFDTAGSPSRSFDIRARRLDSGYIVATVEDVTERARVDSVRTDFVANLSHELKTPIGGIAALADTMIGEVDPQVIQRLTARIVDESYRLSHIIDDLLDLSRIEFGAADYWEPVAMSDVVNEVAARLQHEASRTGITIQAVRPMGVTVVGDRSQLVSALENLVSNAIKYSGSGTTVIVDTRATAEAVSISVIDQGIGIAAKDHHRIFERFYRVDKARSRSTGGSGLGLSIVRHVVSNHGGTVSVASEEGRGSTFTIVLPLAASSEPAIRDLDQQSPVVAPEPERNLTR
ncbi:MAG: two-component sensor histidine kinase [Actinobacteria bacterium]|nr:two-component sensor histidine kinase [Actinomycetota bacterium]NBR76326.1 two-component sensor histidine kinase [Actinomycetota bacterium]